MKRYLLFIYASHPEGGMYDFHGSHDNVNEALEQYVKTAENRRSMRNFHIWDCNIQSVILYYKEDRSTAIVTKQLNHIVMTTIKKGKYSKSVLGVTYYNYYIRYTLDGHNYCINMSQECARNLADVLGIEITTDTLQTKNADMDIDWSYQDNYTDKD